jgi:hypothetical protein
MLLQDRPSDTKEVIFMQSSNDTKYHVHNMHHKEEKIGIADTMEDAIDIAAKDALKHPGKCYDICEGSCENNKSKWFGDSWSIGQYYREHGNRAKNEQFALHNAKRIFGDWGIEVEVTPTDDPDTFKMRR